MSMTLPDETILRFPYACGCNLPLMLTKATPSTIVGLSYHDVKFMFDSATTYLPVADETIQNLTSPQKELMLWHWRLGHINFQWVQMLTAQPRDKTVLPSIITKQPTVSSCRIPQCMACQMAKQARRTSDIARLIPDKTKEMMTKRDNLRPGQRESLLTNIWGRYQDDSHTRKEKN
jgi:GAG-pre-integrase domain